MKHQELKIYEIISKHIRSETTEQDFEYIRKWNKKYPNNQVDLEALAAFNDECNLLNAYQEFSDQEANNNIINAKPKSKKKIRPIYVWSSAAVLLLLIISSFAFWKQLEVPPFSVHGADRAYILLADETEIYLSEDAVVSWEEDFLHNRRINLRGNAFFHVAEMAGKPFVIETESNYFTVLGTAFGTEMQEKITIIRMRDGKLRIESKAYPNAEWYAEGKESVRIIDKEVTKIALDNSDLLEDFSFRNESVIDILESINDRFTGILNYDIEQIQQDCELTANFKELTLLEILEELKLFFNLSYKIQNGKLIIMHLSCI